MRTASNNTARLRGFTLIELLIVVLLLGLGLGVSLTLDFATSPQQQAQQTQLLANALEVAAQDAVLDGRVLGLDFFAASAARTNAYRWLHQEAGVWQPYLLQEEGAEEVQFPPDMTATLTLAGQTWLPEPQVDLAALPAGTPFAPEILLLPTRELTPFTLTLADGDGNASVLTADLMGRVRVDEDAPTPP